VDPGGGIGVAPAAPAEEPEAALVGAVAEGDDVPNRGGPWTSPPGHLFGYRVIFGGQDGEVIMRRAVLRTSLGWLAGLFVVACLGACAQTFPLEIHSYFGPGVKFSGMGPTFDWAPFQKEKTGDPWLDNPQLHDLIRSDIEGQLAQKGYRKATDGHPDFWVDYSLGRSVRGDPYGDAYFSQFSEGTFIIDVVDPAAKSLIWRTYAQARLRESAPPADKEKRLHEAVRRMMASFPQQKK